MDLSPEQAAQTESTRLPRAGDGGAGRRSRRAALVGTDATCEPGDDRRAGDLELLGVRPADRMWASYPLPAIDRPGPIPSLEIYHDIQGETKTLCRSHERNLKDLAPIFQNQHRCDIQRIG